MVAKWHQGESNSREEDDLIHWAKMKRTRYSSRYNDLFALSAILLQML